MGYEASLLLENEVLLSLCLNLLFSGLGFSDGKLGGLPRFRDPQILGGSGQLFTTYDPKINSVEASSDEKSVVYRVDSR